MYKIINKYTKEEYIFLSGTITDTVNKASTLAFSTTIDTNIKEFATFIDVYKKDKLVFSGRVITVDTSMDTDGQFTKQVKAESTINYLSNKLTDCWDCRPGKADLTNDKLETGYTLIEYATVDKIIDRILYYYNYIAPPSRKIQKGNITVSGGLDFTVGRVTCLNVLLNNIVEQKGGYVRIVNRDGTYYLDYTVEPHDIRGENVELSVNQKDISSENTLDGMYNKIYPIGANNLTIATINDGKNYVEDTELIEEYGMIEYALDCNGVTDKATLKKQAEDFLKSIKKKKYSVNVNVADLHYIDYSKKEFELYQVCRVRNDILNINEDMMIVEIQRNLLEPHLPKLTFNNNGFKQTTFYARENAKMNYTLSKIGRINNNASISNVEVENINNKLTKQQIMQIMGV